MDKYPRIQFKKHWQIRSSCAYQLGECSALIQALSHIPLKPEYRKRLLFVSLIKGAQATTAIEGNTLTETEIEQLQEGWKLPASREYQAIEVTNVIDALNNLLDEIIIDTKIRIITPEIAKKYAKVTKTTISRDLKELCDIKLIIKKGRKYKANIEILKTMIPLKKYK